MQNLLEALEHLTGFLIVFLALTILWGITVLVGRLCVRLERPRTPQPVGRDQPALPPPPARAHADDEALPDEAVVVAAAAAAIEFERDEEAIVVIAATVSALLEERHRIVSIRPVISSWGQQGRREIHASHRIR